MKTANRFLVILYVILLFAVIPAAAGAAKVIREEGRIFIVDQLGERWDVTQAVSLGFEPQGFQFGVGKSAFTTLDDTHLKDTPRASGDGTRVIGITDGKEAKAYSVDKMRYHEVANTSIGGDPVAAAY